MIQLLADSSAIFRREAIRYRRDRAYWVGQIAFPLAAVAFFALGLDTRLELPGGTDYAAHLAAGLLVLVVGSGAIGAGFTLIEDRETGFLRGLLLAPVARGAIVLGKFAARALASLALVGVLIALLAGFTPLRIAHPAALLLALVGVTAVFVALGIGLAVRLRRLDSFRLIAAFVTLPLYLLSGIFYPVSALSTPLHALARVNPLTYGVDLFRFGVLGVHELPPALSGALLVALSVACLAGSVALFERGTDR